MSKNNSTKFQCQFSLAFFLVLSRFWVEGSSKTPFFFNQQTIFDPGPFLASGPPTHNGGNGGPWGGKCRPLSPLGTHERCHEAEHGGMKGCVSHGEAGTRDWALLARAFNRPPPLHEHANPPLSASACFSASPRQQCTHTLSVTHTAGVIHVVPAHDTNHNHNRRAHGTATHKRVSLS
jgi:hypothetical protein